MTPNARRTSARRRNRITWDERVRAAYFAQAGSAAIRYGIDVDDVIAHLRDTQRGQKRRSITLRHLEDLVLYLGCADGHVTAWRDVNDRYESVLVRSLCDYRDAVDATIKVRRFLLTLRQRFITHERSAAITYGYDARRPLREWLLRELMEFDAEERHAAYQFPTGTTAQASS